MKLLPRDTLRRLSSPRIWTPPGLVSPVDVQWALKLDWIEGYKLFEPDAYSVDQWRHLMRLRARAWLEQECWLPITSSDFATGLGLLIGGHIQDFTDKDTYTTADAGSSYTVSGAVYVLRVNAWGGAGSGAANKTA